MSLAQLKCPKCGETLFPLQQKVVKTNSYLDCLRRYEPCGVAFSNGRSNPTVIYRNPLHNVPAPVRAGALRALRCSLNLTNRASKRSKFGFSTSEDAVTWTVFSYLVDSAPNALVALGKRWVGTPIDEPAVLLWGVPIRSSSRGTALRKRLLWISNALGELPERRTEPDVVLDYAAKGVVFLEVKLSSGNDKSSDLTRMDRYLCHTNAFGSTDLIKRSGLYQLTRNWRFAWDLAEQRRLRLVNLAPKALFDRDTSSESFEQGLRSCAGVLHPRNLGRNAFRVVGWLGWTSALAN